MSRPRVPLEKVEQQWGTDTLRLLHFEVFTLGHARRGAVCPRCRTKVYSHGTQQTEGVSDVFAFTPQREVGWSRDLLWWEVKRERGSETSDEQVKFAKLIAEMACTQVYHVSGPYHALITWLVQHHWARAEHFPHYRQPKGADVCSRD